MIRAYRLLSFFLLGLLLSALGMVSAHAETYPSSFISTASNVAGTFNSLTEAGVASCAASGYTHAGWTETIQNPPDIESKPTYWGQSVSLCGSNTDGTLKFCYIKCGGVVTGTRGCPDGGTLSEDYLTCTTSDTCPEGQIYSPTSGCLPCTSLSYSDTMQYAKRADGYACMGVAGRPGCLFNSGGMVTVCVGTTCSGGIGAATGGNCEVGVSDYPMDDPASTERPKTPQQLCMEAGKAFGTVNGQVVCVDASPYTPVETVTPKTTTTTDAQGQSTTTTTNTTTTNYGTSTTTSTSTTVRGPDGQVQSTTNTSEAQSNAPKEPSECERNPEAVGCMEAGTVPEAEAIAESAIPVTWTPVAIPKDETCPAPIDIMVGGHAISIEYDSLCTYAAGIRPILLAFAYIGAALLIVAGVRQNA